ncbi:hypothetical protein [Streptomyces sp. B15]|uniref:hypothetical protein n=1 Tax=Streptomyces sp. B15 TaxID=1537797 RepID=UPI001B369B4D|nr:hypothetical protein [Streptomyces sp. B15]MBQ1121891.1 hypothetical protein [Streptomyces sp. B15]
MDICRIAQRFPLVARPRPACSPLTERVREISTLAEAAQHDGGLSTAATALNRAALVASDCGLPDLARDLCWRHAEIYLTGQPLNGQEARLALEPLVNLARLLIRDGDGEGAYRLLADMYDAVKGKSGTTIGGRWLSLNNLTSTPDGHRAVCQWLWTVLLGDGTRALVAAQQWGRARQHVNQHKGVGRRLLDGRQVEVVSRCLDGDGAAAQHVLDESALDEAWETCVAACLAVLCRTVSGQPARHATAHMTTEYLHLEAPPELAVFRARLGLVVLELSHSISAEVIRRLVNDAVFSQDGYVSRDVLMDPICSREMTGEERHHLAEAVASTGLGQGLLPASVNEILLSAAEAGAAAVERSLLMAADPAHDSYSQ